MTRLLPLALLPFVAVAAMASEPRENSKLTPAQMAQVEALLAD